MLLRRGGTLAAGAAAGIASGWGRRRDAELQETGPAGSSQPRRPRVLVTGFTDWHGVQDNVFRCRDNPSCRLLLGEACVAPPIARNGALPRFLRGVAPHVDWCFMPLPTLWGTSRVCDRLAYDAVFHLGLGVYDCHDKLLLEDGAFNQRCCYEDAAGNTKVAKTIDEAADLIVSDACQAASLASVDGMSVASGSFTLQVVGARPENSYICNETHFWALQALAESRSEPACEGRLARAFFIHIPQPAWRDDFELLAKAVGEAIVLLLPGA